MSTLVAVALAATLSVALGLPASASAQTAAEPKVVIIVGPADDATDGYRALADQAAAVARQHTASVVTVYSPDATWSRVKAALQGASLVVYLGHGNGFPSRYRSQPWPYSENGLGLNVVGSDSDDVHQYYGEYYLEHGVKLAPDAVVILSHLCYASGNSEPGLPEDGPLVAEQRVDNYAAGFLAAGAAAVIAEGLFGPAYYVDQVLDGRKSIADIWRDAPTAHGNVSTIASSRSPGHREYLDPETTGAGFYRSLVTVPGLETTDVLAGSKGVTQPVPVTVPDAPPPAPPAILGDARLGNAPAAGHSVGITLPVVSGRTRLPANLTINARWEPLVAGRRGPTFDRAESRRWE